MAKSKSGGTRSYLRGRIANDVYSIGKDAKGKKQQVVRSLAESVANPQTPAQMKGRAVMSTIMQAVSGLAFIIDHSFDDVPNGQPSISEFIRANYGLVLADVNAHPSTGFSFAISEYQQKGIQPGAYLISQGKAENVSFLRSFDFTGSSWPTTIAATGLTAAQVRELIGLGKDDYVTLVAIATHVETAATANAIRMRVNYDLADDTAITSENIASLFNLEQIGDVQVTFTTSGSGETAKFSLALNDAEGGLPVATGYIVSRKVGAGYIHTKAQLVQNFAQILDYVDSFDEAIVTYPIGTERFLNGGDL